MILAALLTPWYATTGVTYWGVVIVLYPRQVLSLRCPRAVTQNDHTNTSTEGRS